MTLGELQATLEAAKTYRVIAMATASEWYVEVRCLGGENRVGRGATLEEAMRMVVDLIALDRRAEA